MIIGIDPGITGACAVLSHEGDFIEVIDIPISAKLTGKGNQINSTALANWLHVKTCKSYALTVYVERVQAMPPIKKSKNGAQRSAGTVSSFNFGFTAGAIEGVVTASGVPLVYVLPQSWKAYWKLTGKDKDAARTLAIQRFPEAIKFLERKKDQGRADALMIALYGAHQKTNMAMDMSIYD